MSEVVGREIVFKTPIQAYDIATGSVVSVDRYLDGQPLKYDSWTSYMLEAQRAGKRIATSSEWSGVQRYHADRNPEFEERFANTVACTGTVIDFDAGILMEGVTINDDGTIKEAKTVLGRKDGIVFPHSSGYIKDLSEACMPVFAYLHGIADPKRELPDIAYSSIFSFPSFIGYVGRGGPVGRTSARFNVSLRPISAGPPLIWYDAWLVDENIPNSAAFLVE